MTTQITDISRRQAALVAGFGLLFMFACSLFASSIESNDVFETIFSSPSKFRTNIVGDVMLLVFDVVAALGLYVFLKPVNRSISLLSAWFRLIHVSIYGASIIALLYAFDLANGSTIVISDSELFKDQVFFLLKGHEYGFRLGLVFFGFHFLTLGYLLIKASYVPNFIGALICIVSIAYLTHSFASILLSNYEEFKTIIQGITLIPAMIAELILCAWLIFAGGK